MASGNDAVFEFKVKSPHDFINVEWTPGPNGRIEIDLEYQGHKLVSKFPGFPVFNTATQINREPAGVGIRLIGAKNGTSATAAFGNYA